MNKYAARYTDKHSISSGANRYSARYEGDNPSYNIKDWVIVIIFFVLCPIVVCASIMTIIEFIL